MNVQSRKPTKEALDNLLKTIITAHSIGEYEFASFPDALQQALQKSDFQDKYQVSIDAEKKKSEDGLDSFFIVDKNGIPLIEITATSDNIVSFTFSQNITSSQGSQVSLTNNEYLEILDLMKIALNTFHDEAQKGNSKLNYKFSGDPKVFDQIIDLGLGFVFSGRMTGQVASIVKEKEREVIADIIESLRDTTKKYQDSEEQILSEMSLLDAKTAKILNALTHPSNDAFPKIQKAMQDIISKSDELSQRMSSETTRLNKERDDVFGSIKISNAQSKFSKEVYELMLASQKRRNTELTRTDQAEKLKQIQEEIEGLQQVEASYSKLVADTLRDDGRARQTIAVCQNLMRGFKQHRPVAAQLENIHKLITNCEKGDAVLHFQMENLDKEIKNLMGTELKYTDACRKAMIQELQAHSKALQQDSDTIEQLLIEMKRAEKLKTRSDVRKTPRF